MSYFEKIQSQAPIWGYDSFGKQRMSMPYTLFDSKQNVTNDGGTWDQQLLSGTSTFSPSGATTTLTVSGTSGAYAIRQTFERFNYNAGKSQNILITAYNMHPQTNVVKRIGYFNSDYTAPYNGTVDGIFWQASGTDFSVNIGNNGVIETASQTNWNIDPLNGSGPSGKTVTDWSKNMIYGIDFEWLGVGAVRLYTVIDGAYQYVHQFNHANLTTGVYMSSPNHSVRYDLRSIGGSGTLNHVCSAVQSEGGSEPKTIDREINNGIGVGVTGPAANTLWGILGFRKNPAVPNAAGIGFGIDGLEISSFTANAQGGWQAVIDPTIGGVYTWLDVPGASGIQYFVGAATNTLTNGTPVAGGYWSNATKQNSFDMNTSSTIGVGVSGNAGMLVVGAYSAGNTVATQCSVSLKLTY